MKLQYVADDGTVFYTQAECEDYEKNFSWFSKVWNGYKDPTTNKYYSGIMDKIDVGNAQNVLKALQKHFEILPKKPNGPLLNNSDYNEQTWQNPFKGNQLLHQDTPTTG